MKVARYLLLICAHLGTSSSFQTSTSSCQPTLKTKTRFQTILPSFLKKPEHTQPSLSSCLSAESSSSSSSQEHETSSIAKRFAVSTTTMGMILLPMVAATYPMMAAAEEYEVAELPPPYIPVFFAILILGGVGWLTSSLGNVIDEEASLGLQSGARAKKERERSRSSYFNKQ
mmetsp:Transcript_15881/g.18788  ORF Transcript_15881/g.18788 Transcript_15881/m.18788 type:complete len:172 (+) Transcript_15881:47-562(+)